MGEDQSFKALTGYDPMPWQSRLLRDYFSAGKVPAALDIPTGLGKTSVIALWLIARARGARLPRRLVYVVDRRAVVDQATDVAMSMRRALSKDGAASQLRAQLGLGEGQELPISTLRGQFADNREWQADPSLSAIVVGTVDMIGSRLLFEGYGVSRRMRPFHAGLLGADALIVLDEAHLVPPFAKLIEQIEEDAPDARGRRTYGPRADAERDLIPPLRLMTLSATGGARSGAVFRLGDADRDGTTAKRLGASKALRFIDPAAEELEVRLAQEAWTLSERGRAAGRIIVFCNSRETAEKTRDAILKHAKAAKESGLAKVEVETELFVGARRVKEREDARQRLTSLGFIAGQGAPDKASFLVATSAGEVGVDLDADHLVCDLVTFDRMVQRFGRVNRRGDRSDTAIVVIEETAPTLKKPDAPTDQEQAKLDRYNRAQAGKTLLLKLPKSGAKRDASPGALMHLKEQVGAEAIAAASTRAPLRPALNRALVDAWSMTSLKEHTGRPEIAPWLRGWIDEEPQTTVVWRTYLPLDAIGRPFPARAIEAFFEAAPPSTNEYLETDTWRVRDWLKKRIATLAKADQSDRSNVLGFALAQSGELRATLRRDELATQDKKVLERAWADTQLEGATLVLQASFGGLQDGMLADKCDQEVPSGDTVDEFATGFGVRVVDAVGEANTRRVSFAHPIMITAQDETPSKWLVVERGEDQDAKALAKTAQLLAEHQDWAETAARGITVRLALRQDVAAVVALAARLHDEGKKATNWQRAFKAPRNGVYGKTKGPINQQILDGYRHEFGSLPYASQDSEFGALPSEMQELALHLIVAHHGNARPVIETRGCDDGPTSTLHDRARDVALRFARLQQRFGPWGLAWLEALVRAADQQASRQLEDAARG